ncbi:MAG: hypothetical protein J6R09_02565, partial [Alistipes sp.]|nr:hypothetical protein [Alistipes sp.]
MRLRRFAPFSHPLAAGALPKNHTTQKVDIQHLCFIPYAWKMGLRRFAPFSHPLAAGALPKNCTTQKVDIQRLCFIPYACKRVCGIGYKNKRCRMLDTFLLRVFYGWKMGF